MEGAPTKHLYFRGQLSSALPSQKPALTTKGKVNVLGTTVKYTAWFAGTEALVQFTCSVHVAFADVTMTLRGFLYTTLRTFLDVEAFELDRSLCASWKEVSETSQVGPWTRLDDWGHKYPGFDGQSRFGWAWEPERLHRFRALCAGEMENYVATVEMHEELQCARRQLGRAVRCYNNALEEGNHLDVPFYVCQGLEAIRQIFCDLGAHYNADMKPSWGRFEWTLKIASAVTKPISDHRNESAHGVAGMLLDDVHCSILFARPVLKHAIMRCFHYVEREGALRVDGIPELPTYPLWRPDAPVEKEYFVLDVESLWQRLELKPTVRSYFDAYFAPKRH
jgi:hypothetical protein